MKILKCLIIITCVLLISFSYAERKNINSFTLTFINQTDTTFTYAGVTGENPTNVFSITPAIVLPGSEAIIACSTSNTVDLAGNLHFTNNAGEDNIFILLNYRKFHMGQPIFSMRNKKYFSAIDSLTINKSTSPLALEYASAIVSIHHL